MCNVERTFNKYLWACYGLSVLSNIFCEKLSSSNRTADCVGSMCAQSKECIGFDEVCNGFLDCYDRSDESLCPEKLGHNLDYSVFIDCTTDSTKGFKCGEKCIPNYYWCNNLAQDLVQTETKINITDCSNVLKTLNHEQLCQNLTFWSKFTCGNVEKNEKSLKIERCKGSYPGQCKISFCRDKSDYIFKQKNNNNYMMKCHDNKTFVHDQLWCDGYIHCPDRSDEDPKECVNCLRAYGFPKNKKSATYSCMHKYTGRPICAIPCDGKDDLCLDDIDEQCSSASVKSTLIFGIMLVIVSVLVGELYSFYIREIKVNKLKKIEMIIPEENSLLSIFKMSLECPSKNKKAFSSLKKSHRKQNYANACIILSYSLMLMEEEKAQERAKAFYKLESKYHSDCKESVYTCIKRNFGTNKNTKHLLSLIEKEPVRSNFLKKLLYKIFFNCLETPFVKYVCFILLLCVKLFAYYTDMYKDIYILVKFSNFLPTGGLKWNSYGYQVFIVLIVSVTLPMILNLFALTGGQKCFKFQSKIIKFGILLCSPMVPAIAVYFISKLSHISQQTIRFHQNNNKKKKIEYSQPIKTLFRNDYSIHQSSSFLVGLRSNENATEHFIQSIVSIVLVAVKCTKSGTVSGFHELLIGGNELFLLGISAIWSVLSIISGKVQQNLAQKHHSVPLTGIMINIGYATLAMACRISALVLYFAPAMGLFNLLGHWKMGNFQNKFYNITENGTVIEVVWKPIHHYEELTYFQLDVYYILFLLIIPIHFLLVAAIKLKFAKTFKTRKDYVKKGFHILHQGNCLTHLASI
jgi:hypothetical protein